MTANDRKYLLENASAKMLAAGAKVIERYKRSPQLESAESLASWVWREMWAAADAVDNQPYPRPLIEKDIDPVIDLAQRRAAACIAHVRAVAFGSANASYVIKDGNSKLQVDLRVAFLDLDSQAIDERCKRKIAYKLPWFASLSEKRRS